MMTEIVTHLPDVIGQVLGEGHVEDGAPGDDPPGVLRVQRARVGRVLFVGSHVHRVLD
ncbi:hypothetical protein ACOZ38_19840 [Sphaerisporangium viridialbum]|uniref:hypothetical protein n=1 Tax=Sphaerisporangium viridialbum TaxID=46189 RepID=UPI003C76C1BC